MLYLCNTFSYCTRWYFLPIYAILRSIPNKYLGIFFSFLFIVTVFILPFVCKLSRIRSMRFRPFLGFVFWVFFFNCILLGWIGGLPVYSPFLEIGKFLTFLYFFTFFFIIPFVIFIENLLIDAYFFKKRKN
jgi:quinol-cytochrome oxidoreductase complex cytochrome b subunit